MRSTATWTYGHTSTRTQIPSFTARYPRHYNSIHYILQIIHLTRQVTKTISALSPPKFAPQS
jgi:hypothetical protein